MAGKITMKQEIFCQEWVDSLGNGSQAALKAFDIEGKEELKPDEKEKKRIEGVASSMANEYLRKPDIIKRIDELLEERGFNDKSVKKEHFKLLKQDSDYGVKMRAIADYYKLKGSYAVRKLDLTTDGKPFIQLSGEIANRYGITQGTKSDSD